MHIPTSPHCCNTGCQVPPWIDIKRNGYFTLFARVYLYPIVKRQRMMSLGYWVESYCLADGVPLYQRGTKLLVTSPWYFRQQLLHLILQFKVTSLIVLTGDYFPLNFALVLIVDVSVLSLVDHFIHSFAVGSSSLMHQRVKVNVQILKYLIYILFWNIQSLKESEDSWSEFNQHSFISRISKPAANRTRSFQTLDSTATKHIDLKVTRKRR